MDLGLVLRSRAACGAPGDTHAPPNDGVALQSVRRLLALACDAVRHMSQCRNGLVHSVPCPPALACSALRRASSTGVRVPALGGLHMLA